MTIYPSGPQDGVKYTLTGQDGNVATFNDPTDANYVGMVSWEGLDSSDIRESLEDRAGADGASQGNNYRGRRPVIGTIEILGTSTIDRNQKWQRLKRAANNLRASGSLKWTPDGGAPEMAVNVRLNQRLQRPQEKGWLHHCQIALVAADPYIYSTALRSTSGITALTTITNQGDGPSYPAFQIAISGTGSITITNNTIGKSIVLPSVSAAAQAAYSLQTGSFGSGNGQFNSPYDVAIDGSGNIFVTDFSNNRVQKFNSSGAYQSQFGSTGSGNGQFSGPTGIALDSGGNIFVCDYNNNRVQKFNSAGTYQSQFGVVGSGTPAVGGVPQFTGPWGLAIDQATNNIFVVDHDNNRVQKTNSAGAWQSSFGSFGSGNGQFSGPRGIALDSTAAPVVVDAYNNRVQKFTNAATPAYASQFGSVGTGNGQFTNYPSGVDLDSSNNIFVTDPANRVQKFNSSGVYQSQFGSYGSGNGQFSAPLAIAVTPGAATPLWVVDYNNSRVQKFTNTTGANLTLDASSGSILSGGNNAYSLIDVLTTTWWALSPGDNSIQVTGSATFTSAAITWRDAWL